MLLTIGLHKDEAKNMKLPRGCKHPFPAVWFSPQSPVEPCQAGACAAAATATSPDCTVGDGRVGTEGEGVLVADSHLTEDTT